MEPNLLPKRLVATAVAALLACTTHAQEPSADDDPSAPSKLIAVLQALNGTKVNGVVIFEPAEEGVAVSASIGGLYPGQEHVLAIHRFGDLRGDDAAKTGDRFEAERSSDEPEEIQTSGLGELSADTSGNAKLEFTAKDLSLTGGANGILGRSVVIRSRKDEKDEDSESAGQAIAVAIIGIARSDEPEAEDASSDSESSEESETPEK